MDELAVVDRLEKRFDGEAVEPAERLEGEPRGDDSPVTAEAPQEAPVETQEETPVEASQDAPEGDASTEAEIASLYDLAEGLGWETDKLYGLKVKTKVDGQEGEATLKDLLASYQIQAHLTNKSMSLSNERKAWEEARTKEQQTFAEKAQKLEAAHMMASQLINNEFAQVNWEQLQRDDPIEFNSKYIQWQQHHARLQHLAESIAHNREAQHQAQKEAFEKLRAEEKERVLTAFPTWSNEADRSKEWAEIIEHAREYGFTDEQVNEVFDHRVIRLLRDAKEYAKLRKSEPETRNKLRLAPKMVKPGNAQKAEVSKTEAIRNKLAKSGSIDDATELLLNKFFGG
jgi:hypothetical protein